MWSALAAAVTVLQEAPVTQPTWGLTTQLATFTFQVAGDFIVCFQPAAGSYAQVGSATLTVDAVAPTSFSDDGAVATGAGETITISGGSGLKLMHLVEMQPRWSGAVGPAVTVLQEALQR